MPLTPRDEEHHDGVKTRAQRERQVQSTEGTSADVSTPPTSEASLTASAIPRSTSSVAPDIAALYKAICSLTETQEKDRRKQEEDRKRQEEERLENRRRQEEERKRQEEERKRQEEIIKRQEEERLEDRKRQEEIIKRQEEERLEDRKRQEEERLEDRKRQEEERRRQEEDRARQESWRQALDEKLEDKFQQIAEVVNKRLLEVEKSIGEVRDRVNVLEDNFKKNKLEVFNRVAIVENEVRRIRTTWATSTACVQGPQVKVPPYDGATSWTAYRRQFETVASANGWSSEQRLTALTVALRGEALLVLEALPKEGNEVESLLEILEARYGDRHLEHVYRAQLRDTEQRHGKNLQQWALEVEKLVRKAYPSAHTEVINTNLVQTFVDGIRDLEVRAAVRLQHHTSMKGALTHALEVEAVRQDLRGQRLRKVVETITSAPRRRFRPMCYGCGERGHIRINCPKKNWREESRVIENVRWEAALPRKSPRETCTSQGRGAGNGSIFRSSNDHLAGQVGRTIQDHDWTQRRYIPNPASAKRTTDDCKHRPPDSISRF